MPTGPAKLKTERTATGVRQPAALPVPALWGLGRGWRWLPVIAVIPVAARAAGAPGAEGSGHGWATWPTGARARARSEWSAGKNRPRPIWRRAIGAIGIERTVAAVGVMVLVMPGDCGTGEEDDRNHEHDARDDHHPRRGLVEARVPGRVWRRRARWRLNRRFGCLGHALIMPRRGPAINQLDARVGPLSSRTRTRSLGPEHPGEFQNDDGDERNSRNDGYPGRYLVKPL
jgi:hypothetical protein